MSIQPPETRAQTHTTFSVTLSVTPGLLMDDELTDSVMDAITESYLRGLQDYMATLGIHAGVQVTMQRCDYVSRE